MVQVCGPLEKHFNARLCATCFVKLKSAVSVPTVPTAPTVPTVPQQYLCLNRLYLDSIYIYICTDCILVLPIFIHRLYLSELQLYHRLLTVEQTHKINKLVTLSLSLSLSLTHMSIDKICSDLHVLRVSSEQDRAIYTGELCVSNL